MSKKIELRSMPSLVEKRNALLDEMETMVGLTETEQRAFSDTESARYTEVIAEIKQIDATLAAQRSAKNVERLAPPHADESVEAREERMFLDYVRRSAGNVVETRSGEQNLTMTNNGAIIPTTIASRIITTVQDICPILAGCDMYHEKGTLKIPVYGKSNTTHDITVAYADEFTDLTADVGQFTSVDLGGYLVGALSLIGQSVINSGGIDVVARIIAQMSIKIAAFLSKELLNGTSGKATGALSTTSNVIAGAVDKITADNLIDLQAKVPQSKQRNACWTMHPTTFTAIKKIKDADGVYLLQKDMSQAFPFTILGKPVNLDDSMPVIGSANKPILYGDYYGLSVNLREDISIKVLTEKYATMHAVGIVAWFEVDSEVSDHQMLATLTTSAS